MHALVDLSKRCIESNGTYFEEIINFSMHFILYPKSSVIFRKHLVLINNVLLISLKIEQRLLNFLFIEHHIRSIRSIILTVEFIRIHTISVGKLLRYSNIAICPDSGRNIFVLSFSFYTKYNGQ